MCSPVTSRSKAHGWGYLGSDFIKRTLALCRPGTPADAPLSSPGAPFASPLRHPEYLVSTLHFQISCPRLLVSPDFCTSTRSNRCRTLWALSSNLKAASLGLKQRTKGHTLWVHDHSAGVMANPSRWPTSQCTAHPVWPRQPRGAGRRARAPWSPEPSAICSPHIQSKICCPVISEFCTYAFKPQLLSLYLGPRSRLPHSPSSPFS